MYNKDSDYFYLDIYGNTKLETIICCDTKITDLKNLDTITELVSLDCGNSRISKLDVSNNIKLTDLDCSHTDITDLNVSTNKELTTLTCIEPPFFSKKIRYWVQ